MSDWLLGVRERIEYPFARLLCHLGRHNLYCRGRDDCARKIYEKRRQTS